MSDFEFGLTPSDKPSWNSGGTAGLLDAERARATFDVEDMSAFLYGGKEKVKRRRWILSETEGEDFSYLVEATREEAITRHLKTFIGAHKHHAQRGFVPTRTEVGWMSANSAAKGLLMNHYGLFLPTLLANCSAEQLMTWLPMVYSFKIVGCYAQTELGHGSNVRGLETTATYDKATETFVLETPTLTSMKWWPGAMGKVATHAVVYAQLIIDNRQFGLHVFMLQLRDENHKLLPGIETGDLGRKVGDEANDTGYMRLSKVRVPRAHMLAKGAIVTAEGKYLRTPAKKENPVMHYATMLGARAGMMSGASGILAQGCTIATRYSLVRRQGFENTSSSDYKAKENKIFDYTVQRYRIMKQTAYAYAMNCTGTWMSEKAEILTRGGDAKELMEALPEVHASAAGLKAVTTLDTDHALEDMRKCCGGNGYLLASGIAMQRNTFAWQVTAEGDVIILLLQLAKFLMKSLESARKGETLGGMVASLAPLKDPNFKLESIAPRRGTSPADFKDPAYVESLLKYRALQGIVSCGDELEVYRKQGMNQDQAWNGAALSLVTTAKSHCYFFMHTKFNEQIAQCKDAKVVAALRRLSALYGCSQILDGQGWHGIVSTAEAKHVQKAVTELMDELRPDACALVDAFDIPDRVLNSVLGRKDGNVYEALFQAAKKSELNRQEVFAGYQDALRPHLDLEFLQNKNQTSLFDLYVDEDACEVVQGEPLPASRL